MSTTFRRPLSVLVAVYSADGHALLLRRSSPFDFWQSVTGSLDSGETHADAARREVIEELKQDPELRVQAVQELRAGN